MFKLYNLQYGSPGILSNLADPPPGTPRIIKQRTLVTQSVDVQFFCDYSCSQKVPFVDLPLDTQKVAVMSASQEDVVTHLTGRRLRHRGKGGSAKVWSETLVFWLLLLSWLATAAGRVAIGRQTAIKVGSFSSRSLLVIGRAIYL